MQKYCEQDVTVTTNLYNFLDVKSIDPLAFDLEHRAATLCAKIGGNGFVFNEIAASELYAELAQRRADLDREMKTLFEDEIIEETFVPKVNNSKLGYQKGVPFIKRKVVEFNPASRKMIGHRLRKKYSWKPTQWTPSGDPKIDETVLSGLPYPEAKRLAEYFLLQKRIGQLAEGRQAWLKSVGKDGKVRHSINSNGTVTGRASHSHFNIAQVPATRAPWGRECRELFTVPPGWELVGADLEVLSCAALLTTCGASMMVLTPRSFLRVTSTQQTKRLLVFPPGTTPRRLSTLGCMAPGMRRSVRLSVRAVRKVRSLRIVSLLPSRR